MAHFELPAAETSRAVAHRTVGELWFVLSGRGELWRKRGTREEVVVLEPGVCVTLPQGTHFSVSRLTRRGPRDYRGRHPAVARR